MPLGQDVPPKGPKTFFHSSGQTQSLNPNVTLTALSWSYLIVLQKLLRLLPSFMCYNITAHSSDQPPLCFHIVLKREEQMWKNDGTAVFALKMNKTKNCAGRSQHFSGI